MVLRVKEFVEHFPDEICQLMKETPNAIELLICCYDLADENGESVIQVLVDNNDMGAVIGRKGNIAKAIRTLVQASAYATGQKRVRIDIDSF